MSHEFITHKCAAAGGHHLGPVGEKTLDHFALTFTKMRLAMLGEDIGYRLAGRPLDFLVGIDERQLQARGQPTTDRRLAAAHQPDEHDGARAEGAANGRSRSIVLT